MLYHSDPSCSSSKVSELRADERKSEQLKLQDVDPAVVSFGETQIPNFCIRDYVFASRSKNNHTSWPFPRRLLKLCLKHGVQDLLPPFEPASSVRDLFCKSSEAETEKNIGINLSQVGEAFLLDPTQIVSFSPSDDKLLSCAKNDNSRYLSEEDKRYNLINEDYEIGSTLTNQCAFERFSTQLSAEPVVQQCGLILKPSVISETSRAEEIASTSTASDLMASKVCPVCKTFSSTSNTTLNAHMDQCLFMASDATKTVDKTPKLLVKPTKKRLMEDIYATAPHCSLEDLDRRNGTSWATDLTSLTPPMEANAETKRLKLISQVDARDDRSEGAVYVDSNGIKLRILSKFNDAPQVISKNVFKPSKNINLVRDGKTSLVSQKKYLFGEKHMKKMKLKMKNKKVCSLKLLKNEAAQEVDHNEESHQEEESADQLSGEEKQTHMSCGTSTLQKWHCSKRSDLPKKICKTNFLKNMVKPGEFVSKITNLEMRNSASGTYSSAKRHFMKLSQTPESKMVDFPANAPLQNMANEVKSLQGCSSKGTSMNVLRLKLAKASGALVPSKNSRNDDLFMGRKQNSPDFPETNNRSTVNRNLSLKTKKISTLSKSNVSTKMLRKNKRKREISSGSNEEQQRCVEAAITSFLDDEISERSLLSGSCQCQDVKTKSSVSQNQNMGFIKFTRASSDKVDGGAIIAKSANGEVLPVLLLDLDDKTSQIMPSKDCERSMERVLLDKQDEKTSDKLENRGVKSQAGAASTESSACLTSHGDLAPDTPRQNCSIASTLVVPNQESNLAINREPSGSPVSSSSISPAFLNVSLTKASDRELLLKPSAAHGNLGRYMADNEEAQASDIEHNQQCKMDFTMNKSPQQSNYHHCCCSRQSIMASTMPTSKPKLIPNLHIRPSISAPFGAYSILHTDTGNITSLESPTGSIMTRSCSVVGSTSPSCGTPSQSSSNSILRLMGKNLMVTHNEESSNLLKIDSPAKDNNSAAPSLPSPLSFTSYVRAPNHENFPFAVCSPVPLMTNMQVRNNVNQSNMSHKAYVTKEVIVFDGSSKSDMMMRGTLLPVPVSHTMFQGPYPYFLPQNQLLLREIGSSPSYLSNEGSSLEVPATLLPRPFLFRPPATPLNPPLYTHRL
ncbi:hypothetical protein IEQ34_011467 [Dendrobium chrysotoxum]|uniref:UBZ4-type domain-containing protein n=1 Tax=Dendrobium chrysotoxum TaxID=161865 RepID=A0AAV7GSJ7_DENCH|nr:hypothetical protein IEQ34_011467 [Dendrobium chrysotoxum]